MASPRRGMRETIAGAIRADHGPNATMKTEIDHRSITAHAPLGVRSYGASPGSHDHGHFQVLIGLDGVLELEVGGRGRRIAAGDGAVVPPGGQPACAGRHRAVGLAGGAGRGAVARAAVPADRPVAADRQPDRPAALALRLAAVAGAAASTLALGIYGLFGFHFLLFIALRHAPPVQANLVNYLWPLGIVVMAPLFLPGVSLTARHVLAACWASPARPWPSWGRRQTAEAVWAWGYLPALGSAFIWASYSLLTKRVAPFPTAAIGSFALVSGLLSLLCHALLEPAVSLTGRTGLLIGLLGLGPLGGAFFLWDAALKRGDARQIGVLSF
jgi:hypothetical protein